MTDDLKKRLRAVCETGCDPDLPFAVAERIEELEAERDELKRELEEESALREKLASLLSDAAAALKGPEAELSSHSWHDVASLAGSVVRQRDELEAEKEINFALEHDDKL